nr:hypothetical protein Q903MT_gene6183 [Picea sitchensis]
MLTSWVGIITITIDLMPTFPLLNCSLPTTHLLNLTTYLCHAPHFVPCQVRASHRGAVRRASIQHSIHQRQNPSLCVRPPFSGLRYAVFTNSY